MNGAWPFTDPVSGREVTLVISGTEYGEAGVRHPGCDQLADVYPDLDALHCTSCGWGGRISGAWFYELWTAP
jgi:hypothetical protein